ncbi:MAG: thioesterase family protein [Burkholderiaceae bacterium]|nr:thioesterase family protein [Burkholderiaceae bacterium]
MSRLTVTGRGSIKTWECDQWGHLNVQFYQARASDALAVLSFQLGLTPSRQRATGVILLPVTDRILFRRELRAGDILFVRSGVRAIATDGTLDVASRMINRETGIESAAFETRLRLVAPGSGEGLPWPDDMLAAAAARAGDLLEAPPPPQMAVVVPPQQQVDRLLLTYRGSVETWECGPGGIAEPRAHIARFNDAITHLFRAMKIDRGELFASGLGSAALDYAITYRQPLRAGQAVEIRSGVLAVGDKVYHLVHHVVDAATGAVLTTILVAALFFDLAARKSVAIPEAVRREAEGLIASTTAAMPEAR